MAQVAVNELISLFQTMYKQHWDYVWGKVEKGCVDCSGAFVWAFKQYGINYPHGSNAIARNYTIGKMMPIGFAKPGMAAFKARVPGESGYDLPDKYKSSGDLSDYYHIGLVDDDPHYVLNAKGEKSGFSRDALSAKNGWDCVAYLKYVDYGEESGKMETARVVLPANAKGNTVNMRESYSTTSDIICRVPVGEKVDLLEDKGQWCKIRYNGRSGWMMSNYLEYDGQNDETGTTALSDDERDQIEQALKAIDSASDLISSIIGRG